MPFPLLLESYAVSVPDLPRPEVEELIAAAVERGRAKHPDYGRFLPGMEYLATIFFCDHAKLPLDGYLETLYCAVKHGDFAKSWRAELRGGQPSPAPPQSPVQ